MHVSNEEKLENNVAEEDELMVGADDELAAEEVTPENDTAVSEEEASSEEPLSLEEQLAAAQAEAEDYKDRWMRSQAEFANARKRMDKQRIELFSTATADVMKKLLPVLDDFDRAMENVPETISEDSWFEGVQLVQRKLGGILETFNVVPIEALGEPFDPNIHEAISQEPTDEFDSGSVCRELQAGYKIGDRVIRPSLVIVAE